MSVPGLHAAWNSHGDHQSFNQDIERCKEKGAKLEQNRSWEGVSLKLKRQEYSKLFLNAFLLVLGAPWGSKNEHVVMEGLQKTSFQEVAF